MKASAKVLGSLAGGVGAVMLVVVVARAGRLIELPKTVLKHERGRECLGRKRMQRHPGTERILEGASHCH